MNKACCSCGKELPATLEFFGPRKTTASGLEGACRECCRKRHDRWCAANPNAYRAAIKRSYLKHREKNRQKNVARATKWYRENRERANATFRKAGAKWRAANKEYLAEARRKYRDRVKADPKLKIVRNMPIYMRQSLKGIRRYPHWERNVGYTRDQLLAHLERQFTRGMSWENFGTFWHIDHIVPIKSFNFTSYGDPDFKACWALANLRPLPKAENLAKSSYRVHLL